MMSLKETVKTKQREIPGLGSGLLQYLELWLREMNQENTEKEHPVKEQNGVTAPWY